MFDVVIVDVGDTKLHVVKVIFDTTGVSLKEAKELTDSVPSVVKKNISQQEAENIKMELENAGAKVELRAF